MANVPGAGTEDSGSRSPDRDPMQPGSLHPGSLHPGRPLGMGELFSGWLMVGLLGFGGIPASAQYVLVERRKWLTQKEFVELLGVGSVIPGGNVMNVSVMIGDRHQGVAGAAVSLMSLLFVPLILLVLIATTWDHFAHIPEVRAATAGAASAAAGLIIGTAGRLIHGIEKSIPALVFALATFAAVGLFRVPLAAVILVIIPLSVTVFLYRGRRR